MRMKQGRKMEVIMMKTESSESMLWLIGMVLLTKTAVNKYKR